MPRGNHTGERYGRWTILEKDKSAKRYDRYICICDCGCVRSVILSAMVSGASTSCGCYNRELNALSHTVHGESKNSRLYRIWKGMLARCYNKSHHKYAIYGARGIKVYDAWKTSYVLFRDWAYVSGYKDNLSIDRIDVNKGYYPENCRWADNITQANNTSRNRWITANGECHTLAQWSRIINLNHTSIISRIKRGWSEVEAVTIPRGGKRSINDKCKC